MKILFVIPSPLSFRVFLSSLTESLSRNGVEVHVVCKKYDSPCYLDGVKYHFVDFPRNADLRKMLASSRALKKIVRSELPDLIHVHFSSAAFLTYLAHFRGFPKTICTIQGLVYTLAKGWFKRFFYMIPEVLSLRKCDISYVLTEDDYMQTRAKVPKIRCQYAPGFGGDLSRFTPLPKENREKQRNELGFLPTDKIVIYVGRIVRFKGFDIALKAFIEAQKTIPELKFLVCGSFDPIHTSGLSDIELEELKSNPSIKLTGFVENLHAYLSIADITIFPSTREGMPVNLMESIACGVPVLTSNSRGCRHVVKHNYNGIVVSEQAPERYAAVIVDLMRKNQKLEELRENCISSRGMYDRKLYISETLEAYNELLNAQLHYEG